MSRDCYETGVTLLTPHVEIELLEKGRETITSAGVNASAFNNALAYLLPPASPERGPLIPDRPYYRIYGVVGRIVNNHGWAYLNIAEPPISKTLMGYLTEEDFKRELPKTFEILKQNNSPSKK